MRDKHYASFPFLLAIMTSTHQYSQMLTNNHQYSPIITNSHQYSPMLICITFQREPNSGRHSPPLTFTGFPI